jgi:hypothetical protein
MAQDFPQCESWWRGLPLLDYRSGMLILEKEAGEKNDRLSWTIVPSPNNSQFPPIMRIPAGRQQKPCSSHCISHDKK